MNYYNGKDLQKVNLSFLLRMAEALKLTTERISFVSRWAMTIIGATLAFMTLVFLAWASDKGLDITDEGCYLLGAQFPSEVKIFVNTAHNYNSIIYCAMSQNVIGLRLAGLFSTMIAASVFFLGFYRLTFRFRASSCQTSLFTFVEAFLISLGAMIYYAWFLPTPSYNSLNGMALTAGSGFYFFALAELEKLKNKSFRRRLGFFLVGLCVGISFYVKFPTGISLFGLFVLALVVWPRQELKTRLRGLGFIALGLIAWILFHFIFIQSPTTWWQAFCNGIKINITIGGGQDVSALKRYFNESQYLVKNAIFDFLKLHIVLLIGFTFFFFFKKALRDKIWVPSIFILSTWACAVWQSYYKGFYLGGERQFLLITRFYLGWLMLLTTTVIVVLIYQKQVKYFLFHPNFLTIVLFAAVLFLLPFAGAVGTGNYLYVGTLWHMAPWFGLLLMLLAALTWLLKDRWILPMGTLIISGFACAQILSGCWYEPYRLNKGLWAQTQATEIGYPTTVLKLDPTTSEFFNKIRQLASENGFKPGDDVLGFSNLPGVVFALGGRSPGIPWYNCGYEGSRAFAEKALSLVPPERLKRAFILQTLDSAKCMPDLAKFGINFPGDYILCGELIIPYPEMKNTVQFWKPRSL